MNYEILFEKLPLIIASVILLLLIFAGVFKTNRNCNKLTLQERLIFLILIVSVSVMAYFSINYGLPTY